MYKVFNMENKDSNLLLIGLAGIGLYYFLKNKSITTSVVPPTTGELPENTIDEITKPFIRPAERGDDYMPPANVENLRYDYQQEPDKIFNSAIEYDFEQKRR